VCSHPQDWELFELQGQDSPNSLDYLVERLAYRTKLSEDDRAAILALPSATVAVERNQFIIRERDLATHTCLILRGFSIRSTLVATGHRQIVAVHMRGDVVDLQSSLLRVADHNVQMLTPGRVAMIPREEIIRLTMERPGVAHAMWIDTLVDGSILREWIANVGRRDARTRIAHLLCELAIRLRLAGLGEDTHYELPITQEQLADATGMTPVHVNRTLRALEAEGLVERPHPRAIWSGDWRRLAKVGDFDPSYLHLRKEDAALS
jgi:CRP-like cAMP-binding protein